MASILLAGSYRDGTTISLTGTGFGTTINETHVLIGGERCDVISASTSEILCQVGQGPAGNHEIIVNVADKGLANHTNGVLEFTYLFNIDGISPSEGSLAGTHHSFIYSFFIYSFHFIIHSYIHSG